MDSTIAIVLRKTKLTETSIIVSWLTVSDGIIRTVAKGARKPRSRFAGMLDLFYECEIQFVRSRTSELHILKEVILRETRENLRLDFHRVALAGYFVQLLELVVEPDAPAPELFDLLQRALNYLNENPADLRAMRHFENELVRLLGIQRERGDAATAIGDVYHRMPPSRRELLRDLA